MIEIRCNLCEKIIKKPDSQIAGVGPVCHKKIHFAERLKEDNDLQYLMKEPMPAEGNIENNKTLIFQDNFNRYKLGTILKNKTGDIIYLDRRKINKTDNLAKSYTDAISLESESNIKFVSKIGKPTNPDIKREFNKYNKEYLEHYNNRENYNKELIERGLYKDFPNIESKEDLSSIQENNRDLLFESLNNKEEKVLEKWKSGQIHKETISSRIIFDQTKEGLKLQKIFEVNECEDYGLTNEEIFKGLYHSKQKPEAYIFKAYTQKNLNLNLMIKIYTKLEIETGDFKIKLLKLFPLLCKNQYLKKEDLKKYLI